MNRWQQWRARRGPIPPEDVKVVREDGSIIPVELVYLGRTKHGTYCWANSTPIAHGLNERLELLVRVMPPRTQIRIGGPLVD